MGMAWALSPMPSPFRPFSPALARAGVRGGSKRSGFDDFVKVEAAIIPARLPDQMNAKLENSSLFNGLVNDLFLPVYFPAQLVTYRLQVR